MPLTLVRDGVCMRFGIPRAHHCVRTFLVEELGMGADEAEGAKVALGYLDLDLLTPEAMTSFAYEAAWEASRVRVKLVNVDNKWVACDCGKGAHRHHVYDTSGMSVVEGRRARVSPTTGKPCKYSKGVLETMLCGSCSIGSSSDPHASASASAPVLYLFSPGFEVDSVRYMVDSVRCGSGSGSAA